MSRNVPSNIKQLLSSFDSFVKILEDPNWTRTAKTDDIKTAFKLGRYIERTIEHFVSNDSVTEYINVLQNWWKANNRLKVYNEDYFSKACDKLLTNFFQTENMSDNSLDIAVRVYSSIFPKDRMEKVISDAISMKSSYEAISDFINIHISKRDVCEIECYIKLQNWTFLIQTCKADRVSDEIGEMLSHYKVESSLYLLTGILSLEAVDSSEKQTQEIILKFVTDKMLDRSILSKPFWLTLFKNISVSCVSKVCVNFERFFDSFINFIIYCGSMMKNENSMWISDPVVSVCPEIAYHDILKHVKALVEVSLEMRTSVTAKLRQAKQDTESSVWDKILLDLK